MQEPVSVTIPHNYEPRAYQLPFLRAMDQGCRRAVQVWHRRSGKEKTDLAGLVSKKMLERVGSYYYVFPEFTQGRKILWDGADKDGFRFIDHFPRALLHGKPNDTEMKLRLKKPGTNEPGSLFQIIGSDRFNSVMGTNPIGMVFSEYSLQDPLCWGYFRPILAENDGWAVFNFTPRGENHAYDLHELARADAFDAATGKGWFDEVLTVNDTRAIRKDVLEQERKEILRLYGNEGLYLQEYFCSFTIPVSGAYYAEQIAKLYRDGRVGFVPHEERLAVDTWWDLGLNDRMSIWFTQTVGKEHRIIDFMEGTGYGLPHYIRMLRQKEYVYGRHVAPHDIEVRELGTDGKSRREVARSLGVEFEIAPKVGVLDGIDAARALFSQCFFDKEKTKAGLAALKGYRKQYDEKRKTYLSSPYHDWTSNAADAFRIMAVALDMKHASRPARRERYQPERRPEGGSSMGALG